MSMSEELSLVIKYYDYNYKRNFARIMVKR